MTVAMSPSTPNQRLQIGMQTVDGTGVAATKRWPTLTTMISPETASDSYMAQGNKFTSIVVPNTENSSFKVQNGAGYDELIYIFNSLFGGATPSTSGGISTWTMGPRDGTPDIPQLYTFEYGDSDVGIQTIDNAFTDFDLEWSRKGFKYSGGGIGKAFTTGFTMTSQAAIWTATLGAGNSGGTFTLTFGGQTTAGIAYNATGPLGVQAAFVALSSVGAGNATVTGSAGGPYTIHLQGALNGASGAITASGASLTGGTATVTMAQTNTGITFASKVPVQPGTVAVYLDSSFGGIGGTKMTDVRSGKFSLSGRWVPDWIVDSALASYYRLAETAPKATLSLKLTRDSNAMGHFADYRAGTLLYLRLAAVGPIFSGSTHRTFTLDVPVQFEKMNNLEDDGGIIAINLDLAPISDPTAGYPVQATIVTDMAAL